MSAANEPTTQPQGAQRPEADLRVRSVGAAAVADELARLAREGADAQDALSDSVADDVEDVDAAASQDDAADGADAAAEGGEVVFGDAEPAPSRARGRRLNVWLSDDEYAQIEAVAKKFGKPMAAVVRDVATAAHVMFQGSLDRAARRERQDAAELEKAVRAMQEMTAAYNELSKQVRTCGYHQMQLARHANSGGAIDANALEAVLAEQKELLRETKRVGLSVSTMLGRLTWAR